PLRALAVKRTATAPRRRASSIISRCSASSISSAGRGAEGRRLSSRASKSTRSGASGTPTLEPLRCPVPAALRKEPSEVGLGVEVLHGTWHSLWPHSFAEEAKVQALREPGAEPQPGQAVVQRRGTRTAAEGM